MSMKDQAKVRMGGALEHFKLELKNLRTGRANPAILDHVTVEIYGSQMRIKEVASINAPEPRMLVVTPFDGKNSAAIGKAIEKANIGLQPIVDGNVVRLKIPMMDENARKEMIKIAHRRLEECKVGVRNARRDLNELVRKMKQDGEIAEDIMKKYEKEIQELTDQYCHDADKLTQEKEKEIMTV